MHEVAQPRPTPGSIAPSQPPKLMDQMREALRSRHYSRRTETGVLPVGRRFIRFHKLRHPAEMAEPEINAFLTHLAVEEKVSASTQTQALSALLFLYRHVIGYEVGDLGGAHPRAQAQAPAGRDDARRGAGGSRRAGRREVADGVAAVRGGPAADGVPAAARAGHRLRAGRDPRARRQGREGPRDDAARVARAAASGAARGRASDAPARPGRRAGAGCRCRTRSTASTQAPAADWRWQWVFPQETRWRERRDAASRGGTTCTRRSCSGR